jgi:pyruvate kinase
MIRRTKIVGTIGPSSWTPEILEELIESGLNVVRINFSHGDRESKRPLIEMIRTTANRMGRPIAILQDLAGPKVRIGTFEDGPIYLRHGQHFTLTTRDVPGCDGEVGLVYKGLPDDVKEGDCLMLADGALELTVTSVDGPDILCKVVTGGELSSNKGINLPSGTITAPILDEKDIADLKFGLEMDLDYVALSFVRTGEDVQKAIDIMDEYGKHIPIIAKIEQQQGIANIGEIMELADGVMVARGDLGVEIPFEEVPCIQKDLIGRANDVGSPVITATQMLKSMVESPRPTRAEVSDVANAILDGSDAVMLSEEMAMGDHPVLSVKAMHRIATSAETIFPYSSWAERYHPSSEMTVDEAVARSAVSTAEAIKADAIVTLTKSGSTTRLISKYRPIQPILAMTDDENTYRQTAMIWGATPLLTPSADDLDQLQSMCLDMAVEQGLLKRGQTVVLTAGVPLHEPGCTNLVKVVMVGCGDSAHCELKF